MKHCASFAALVVAAAAAVSPANAQDAWARADSAVVRLSPSVFPELPQAIRADLERRGCTVPQTDADTPRQNVITGAFTAPGSHDWAVLCSINFASRILVYRGGLASAVDSLAASPDKSFLQTNDGGRIVFSRSLTTVGARAIAAHGGLLPSRVDHQGIEDSFVDKASTIFYLYESKWLRLEGSD